MSNPSDEDYCDPLCPHEEEEVMGGQCQSCGAMVAQLTRLDV